ncbi:MAG TPA: ATP-binding cassette domain-containing protein [Burkholderiales bacterium]|jgi:ABC-type multidrug transport system ATPase subunit|nr:ATP-binding cassette domain-containing protein [Burkholderiales bacterium]HSA69283.1 ATP-binding cassette domain-containing protein [Burkholderiales bacterium]
MTLLSVEGLAKEYRRRWKTTFRLEASFTVEKPEIVGVMGPNGSGKTTLFELITGSNTPSAGRVLVAGQDIHRVKARSRDRLAIHYHQSYQVRRFRKLKPDFLLDTANSAYPMVHLFDEPQFNTQDGYIGFMLDFFRRLRSEDRVVFLCLHPTERYHLEILREVCERFVFVEKGRISLHPNFAALEADARVSAYLGQSA